VHKTITILLSSFFVFTSFAQSLSIRVENAVTKETLPGAHINLYLANGKLAKTYVTDVYGQLKIDDKSSQFKNAFITASFIGYENDTIEILSQTEIVVRLNAISTKLNEVVVTGQYGPSNPEKSVHKVRVITAEKIEAMQAVNLRDVLTNELNVRLSQDGVLGSGMQMQGVSGQNVKIMMGGVPVIGRLNGNVDISQINMNDVERIEIVEGPLSVVYGTNALAGTINIITKKGVKKGLEVNANSYLEHVGTFNIDASVSGSIKENQLRLSIGRNYFDGWDSSEEGLFNYFEPRTTENRSTEWNPKEQYFGRLDWSRSFKKWDVNAQLAQFTETITNRGEARMPLGISAFDDTYFTQRTDATIGLNKNSEKSRLNVVFGGNYFERRKNTYVVDLSDQSQELTTDPTDQDTSIFRQAMSRANYVYQWKPTFSIEVGYDINLEDAVGERIEDDYKSIGDYALFSTAEWKPLNELTIKPGVRVAYNSEYQAPITPAINLLYKKKGWSLRGSFAQGFRAPDLKELYFYFVDINHNIQGNQDLKAEYSNNYSASLAHQWVIKKTLVGFEVNGFLNQIEDRITLAQVTSDEFSYVNIGSFQTQGLTVKGNLSFEQFNFQAGFNYIGRENLESEDFDVERFTYAPEVQSSLQYTFSKHKISLAAFYKYTGELQGFSVIDGEVTNTAIEDYNTLDITVGKRFFNDALSCSFGMKNIFNVQQINSTASSGGAHSGSSNSVLIGMGRVGFIQFGYRWKK